MRNVVLGAFASLLLAACGGGGGGGGDYTYISGRVMLGPVDGATVVAYRVLDTGALGPSIGDPVTTDSAGRYRFLVEEGFSGLAGVVATEGTYVDEATGASVTDPELELIGFATVVENGEVTAQINALTTIAAHCGVELARNAGTTAEEAVANAAMMVEEYFGLSDLLTTEPAELTAGAVTPGNAADYGAANAGLSQLAADLDMPLMDLIDALGYDGADCVLAGDFYGAEVEVWTNSGFEPVPIDAGGRMLAEAIVGFLESARNRSGLGDADVQVDETIEDHIVAGAEGEFSFILLPPRVDEFLPPVGELAGGTVVTFRGDRLASLAGAMQVTFGGVPATVLIEDDDMLEVMTPPGAVSGKVDVRIADPVTGLYLVLHEAFEYYTPGLAPTITRIWPELGPVVGGTLVDVIGTNFDPAAVVRIGGQPAEVVAYLGRTALVVAAPPNATPGDYDVVVWQSSGSGAPSATLPDAFEYRTRDVGLGFDNGDVAGAWKLFTLDYGTSGDDTVTGVVADVTFDGGGTATQSGTAFVTSPTIPDGTLETIPPDTRDYALFEDGTLWFENPGDAVRAGVTDEADVLAFSHIASDGINTIGVGVRRGSGMSDASLTGTWHVAAFGHVFWGDGRYVTSALGIAEFDGAGGGTVSLLSGEVAGVDEGSANRAADVGGLDYSVNADGTLTMELLDPDGGAPFMVEGILAQRGDILVGLGRSDGEIMLVMMTPRGRGLVPDWAHGSWRGMGFNYGYDPVMFAQIENGLHRYTSEAFRILTDAEGGALIDIEGRTSGEPDRGVYQEMFLDRVPLDPSGYLGGGPSDVFGFMSPSRRFMVFLPTSFAAGPDTDPIEFMGTGLLVRGPSFYSKYSIEGRHPMVGMSKEFIDPGEPPPFTEEVSQFLTVISFFPSLGLVIEDGSHEGMGVARQVSDRMEKVVRRYPDGDVDVDLPEPAPWRQGGYAVAGDGRIYLFLYEDQQLTANAAQVLQMLVGDLTPDGAVTVMRAPKGMPIGAMAVLVPESETDVPVDGLYNFGQFDLGYVQDDWDRGIARAGRGVLDFDTGDGTYTGSIDIFTAYEYGGTDSDDTEFSGGFEVVGSFFGSGDIVGIVTPDGSAMFNLNFDPEVKEINLSVVLRAPDAPVASAGSFRQAEMYHEYAGTKGGEGADPAMFETGKGNFSVRQTFDAAYVLAQNVNTAPLAEFTEIEQELYADASLAVNTDGSVSWPIFSGVVMRGSFDATARYLFLVSTDPSSELTNHPTLIFIYRR